MKKLIHIVESAATGTLSVILDLCRVQAAAYELIIAYGVRPDTPADIEQQFHRISPEIKMVRIVHFTRSLSPSEDRRAYGELKKLIVAEKPDMIHLHSSKAGAIGRLLLLSPAVRHILKKRADGTYAVYYTPHSYGFLQQDCPVWKCGIYKLAEFVCGHLGANTIACCEWEYAVSKHLTKHRYYVDNGIHIADIDRIVGTAGTYPAQSAQPDMRLSSAGRPVVYTSGRITKAKNPALFLQIAEACPDMQFVWIGDGESRDMLQAPNIRVTGRVGHDEAIRMAAEADIFILPSLWEGLSISLLEAMYLGKICIVSDIPQNQAVIADGVNGYVCHSAEDYGRRLLECRRLLQASGEMQTKEPGLCHTQERVCEPVGRRAHADVCDRYTSQSMAQGYIDIYEENRSDEQNEIQSSQ